VAESGGKYDHRNPSHKMLMSQLGAMSESERQHVHRLADGWQGSTIRSVLENPRYTVFGRWTKHDMTDSRYRVRPETWWVAWGLLTGAERRAVNDR
jgi:hypothetical protein